MIFFFVARAKESRLRWSGQMQRRDSECISGRMLWLELAGRRRERRDGDCGNYQKQKQKKKKKNKQ